ncbi:MAG TPA: hypothetical protein HPP77_07195, partial [Candidatus Hydrogenedentes bacterium]|nr:hypothetical protein [Candidatus Hydrogenedentota bacterium]
EEPPRWFVFVAAVDADPKLESEQLIDPFINRAMHVLAPTYDDVKTIGDIRAVFLLWPPHAGGGRVLSDRWAVLMQAGYSVGKVRTKDDDRSIFLLPLHTDLEIQRGALYAGLGVDYFPFGMMQLREYDGMLDRLRAAKPYLGARITWTYATYNVKVKAGFKPFGNLINLEQSDAWLLPSINTNVGLEIPFNERNGLSVNFGCNFFDDEQQDFEGPSLSVAWKHFLRRRE